MILNDNQKKIYNLYLRAYRINNNKPFRDKKDFSDIENKLDVIAKLEKIEKVFVKYPNFFNKTYFDAPYIIYNDEKKFFPLSFYSSQKGITTCIAFYKTLLQGNPDIQLSYFKDSLKFIAEFCIEKQIRLREYVKYCSVAQNDCFRHLKEHRISWYTVFAIPLFLDSLYNMPQDEFNLYYGDEISLSVLYNKYISSKKARTYLEKGAKKISQFIDKSLNIQ